MRKFLLDRVRLVRELSAQNDIRVEYADLALILCSVLSACAAARWPGRQIDRNRFIELLVGSSPACAHTIWVSVPALINRGLVLEADTPYGKSGAGARIFTDAEIDLSYDEAREQYPSVGAMKLKQYTYASLIYEWLRCGYAHEYCPDGHITHFTPSRREARISYIGRTLPEGSVRRMVGFHLDYLVGLADFHASHVEGEAARPERWWIEQV